MTAMLMMATMAMMLIVKTMIALLIRKMLANLIHVVQHKSSSQKFLNNLMEWLGKEKLGLSEYVLRWVNISVAE